MQMVKITGMSTVLSNLRKSGDKIARGIERGLVKGGKYLQRESQKIVPVQLGALKNSAFTRNVGGSGVSADIIVGYTEKYAVFVHEDISKTHGREFNILHADEIANAGTFSSSLKTGRTTFKAFGKMGKAAGGMFPRGEEQQAKFLETPARYKRKAIIRMVAREASKI